MREKESSDLEKREFIKTAGIIAAGTAAIAALGSIPLKATAPKKKENSGILNGKTAFITGAARGIGKAIAMKFAEQGANIVMIDIADPAKLSSTKGYRVSTMKEFDQSVAAVKALGVRVMKIQADVRDLKAMQKAAHVAFREFGCIDVAVANAGYVAWHSFEDGTIRQWEDVVDVNILGVFYTAKSVIPYMKSKGGKIINLASVGGRCGFAGNGAYTATKWAVIGMTKQAAIELGKYNITVNAIAPGPVNTAMYRSVGQMESMGVSTPEGQDKIIGPMLPLGKAAMEPEDIADTALFLAGATSATISGAVIDNALGFNANYTA